MFSQFQDLLTVFLILYLMNKFSCSCPVYWMGYTHVLDDVLPNTANKMVSTNSKIACMLACTNEPQCVAVAFHKQRKECHLYTRNAKELTTDPDPGMAVFVMITDGSNVASLNSPSTSSVGVIQPPRAALDNDNNTCFQTDQYDYQPWFLLDLMDTFLIRFIVVYNEAEYPERLHDVNYEVYDADPTIGNFSEANCCASVVDYTTGKNIIRCNKGVQGRFVKISIEKSNFLTLCEVEIYGTLVNGTSDTCNQRYECNKLPGGDNIALGKPTEQTSFLHAVYSSSKAVDGNRNGMMSVASCQATAADDYNPWWQVDLASTYDITSITISNRYDDKSYYGTWLSNVSVIVYNSYPTLSTTTSKLCVFIPGVFGGTVRTFKCDEKTVGRFIKITKPTEYLNMCEVEVTGIQQ
ncbi:uncharacterized protein LOC126816467 [Patella vulgata]|uniref:uncharacterized protein LOC126816467 n=1 Tax=Patella vulgata TaxID=6465 RepID=UPI00217FD424|nr:uncharacterized protein LOC126816467 [Patella vulgata]